jgi:hypothetical protein
MKLGAEPRKAVILAVLLPVAAYLIYSNFLATPSYETAAQTQLPREAASTAAPGTAPPPPVSAAARQPATRRPGANSVPQEWTPTLKPKGAEERSDVMTADPTLKLDLLAKLRETGAAQPKRSLFEFAPPPAPKAPEPKIVPKPVETAETKPPEPAPPKEPPKPPVTPIPLKFYGFINGPGGRRAFFLNGEDILVASEGETVKSRYKVIRIGLTSAVVEDTEQDHQQTLPLEQPAQG